MTVQIFNCEQGSPEWHAARLGIPTASEFKTILAKGEGKTRRTYMLKLLGERMTGEQMYSYENEHTQRGKDMEEEARDKYVLLKDAEVTRVGFIRNGDVGCSPDSLIGNDGMLEIKTKLAHLQADLLLGNAVPSEHIAQLQGQLWVAEREWVDFVSYWPRMPTFVRRVHRDEPYIRQLAKAVEVFENELGTMIAALRPEALGERLRASLKTA